MNWLAHVFLSQPNIHQQLGNILADPLKGRVWPGADPQTHAGFAMHQQIDKFTDSHPCFIASKNRLGERGLLRGAVIDVVYDHLLTKHWQNYSDRDFQPFIAEIYQQAPAATQNYPANAAEFIHDIIEADILRSYATLDGVATALQRIDRRLSARVLKRESASSHMPAVRANIDAIEEDFLGFFVELVAAVDEAGVGTG